MFDLLKNKEVKDLTLVPENLRGLYQSKADNSGFEIRSSDAGVASAIAAITGLSGALTASRTECDTLKRSVPDLSPLKDYGDTPQAIAEKVQQMIKDLSAKGGEAAAAIERVKHEMGQVHQTALSEKDKALATMTQQLHEQLVGAEINRIASEKGVDSDLLRPFVMPNIKVVSDPNGKLKPVVVEPDGKTVRYSQKVAGAEMGVSEAVEELLGQEKFKVLVPSKAPVGGGAVQPNRQVQRPAQAPKSAVDKISAGIKKLG
ncbi:MAG: hypothetical protein EHM35_00810 [Planctomycetaceae bacterium]|nr:MAG: hypothetical protein EHM35_00810 [Planctomycetaceae bacterium]